MRARSPVSDMLFAALVGLGAGCSPAAGTVVTAPSLTTAPPPSPTPGAAGTAGEPAACAQSWALEDAAGGSARVIVVCGSDLQRVPITAGPMTRALDPALDLARQKVCECAERRAPPAFVDLVITAYPREGRATVEQGEIDESLDPHVAQAFAACVGSLRATFTAFDAGACGDGSAPKYVYALNVEL